MFLTPAPSISDGNFNVLLNGTTAGTDYAQLNVTGSVYSYGNLNVSLGGGYTPTVGDTYMIIKNDGTDAVSGTFDGLAEGATINVGGYDFQISYVGGTGNDVVLKAITGTPDTTPPTATIDQAVGQDDPTNAGTIHFTVVFSKMVSGFTASDISFSGSTDHRSLDGDPRHERSDHLRRGGHRHDWRRSGDHRLCSRCGH